jgi:hypothetical protein
MRLLPLAAAVSGVLTRCVTIYLLMLASMPSTASAQSCVGNPVSVQILGSGGPYINRDRASTESLD